MEENNDIFLAGGDAPVYWAEPMHKKYFTKLFWSNALWGSSPQPVCTCTHF